MPAPHRAHVRAVLGPDHAVSQPTRRVPKSRLRRANPEKLLGDLFTQHHLRPVDAALPRGRIPRDPQSSLSSLSQIVGSDTGLGVPPRSLSIVKHRSSAAQIAAYSGRSRLVQCFLAHWIDCKIPVKRTRSGSADASKLGWRGTE